MAMPERDLSLSRLRFTLQVDFALARFAACGGFQYQTRKNFVIVNFWQSAMKETFIDRRS
jgi:hypothetical protein